MTDLELRHRYEPWGSCAEAWERRDPEVLMSGPAGTGKSRALLQKLHTVALKHRGMRGLIVRKTLASLGPSALVTWEQQVIPEFLATRTVTYHGGSSREPPHYRYQNGSVIVIGGMDKASRHMSTEYDLIYVQEAIELTEDDWEALTTRLRNGVVPYQQMIADTNPDTPIHWLKQRCDRGQTVLLESRHEDNPTLFDRGGQATPAGEVYIARLDGLTGPRYHRLRRGLWVAAEGVIYEGFDPAIHLVDRFHIPADWPRFWTVDFGYTNPFVLQWWAQDHDGRLWLYRELYRTRTLVEDHAKVALAQVRDAEGQWREPKPRAVICDHDAEDRATLERHLGIGTVAATKNVSEGLQAVQSRLRPAGDGKPRLFLLRDSVVERDAELVEAKKPACTAEEIPGYVWQPAADGKPDKDQPLKMDDHGCDAMRYAVAECDLGARPRVRFV
jgi:phage terminase large subunit